MSSSKGRPFELSDTKRALLEALLRKQGVKTSLIGRIPRREQHDRAPLSSGQQRLWFIDQFEPGSPLHNIHAAINLVGKLNVDALERGMNEIVRRHESLRTRFVWQGEGVVQVVDAPEPRRIEIIDLTHLESSRQERESQRLSCKEAQEPFDLGRGPLLRAKLLRFSDEQHRLFVTMHHIVSDGWSIGVFMREVGALYEAYCIGKQSPLKELPIQYADFAVWQRGWLETREFEGQLKYWKDQLAGSRPLLELPTDYPRPKIQTHKGVYARFKLSKQLSDGLKELSRREGATLFMTMLAAFDVLLYRYSGQEDIIVGTPIANRNREELEPLIGFFVNTLVMRVRLGWGDRFGDVIRRVKRAAIGAYEHQEVAFEKVVEELRPERDLSHTPLFQVMFILQNAPLQELELPDLKLSQLDVEPGVTEFDLTLSMAEKDQSLIAAFDYNTDLFESTTISRMIGHFLSLLEGIVANPNRLLYELPMLTGAELRQLLIGFNEPGRDYKKDICLHELFEAQVARNSNATAIVFEGRQLSYGKLNTLANKLACRLRVRGVGPEMLVGIYSERSIEAVIAILGVLKAGAAFVPLDPEYPERRINYMIEDAGLSLVLAPRELIPGLHAQGIEVMPLDVERGQAADSEADNLGVEVDARNAAYVIYTSGSTGEPKGVMITHFGICNRLQWGQDAFPVTESDGMLHSASLSFDVSVWEMFAPLVAGARLIIARAGAARDSRHLVELMAGQNVTVAGFTPSLLQALLDEPLVQNCAALRQVLAGAEPLSNEVRERFQAYLDAELYNFYGPTETTIDATFYACKKRCSNRATPIGRPLAYARAYILEPHFEPVPIGVRGEVHIAGAGLARGYVNRADKTAEKFLPDPFNAASGARMYRSGDIARYLPDGNIEFVGRTDQQVKIRGQRVELGEVESVLTQHPSVRQAVALAREDTPGGDHLVGYLTLNQGKDVETGELRDFVTGKLPGYMVPRFFVVLDDLPVTANGKIDRAALPAPDLLRRGPGSTFVAPRDAVEEVVADIFREVLKVRSISITDNFFELGGHSLLATQVASRVRTTFQVDLPLRGFFLSPSVAALSEAIRIREASPGRAERIAKMKKAIDQLSGDEVEELLAKKKVEI